MGGGLYVIAFPLAAGLFYPFVLSPEVAAMSMPGSTLVVAISALMLKRTKLVAGQSAQTSIVSAAEPPVPSATAA